MTTTRERAINLRDWEVRAIQEGRLKLLVRPVKVNPAKARGGLILKGYLDEYGDSFGGLIVEDGKLWHRDTYESPLPEHDHAYLMPCPLGKPGDRLRGREAAAELSRRNHAGCVAWKRVGTCVDATDLEDYCVSTAVCALGAADAVAIAESLIRREMLGDTSDANAKGVKP